MYVWAYVYVYSIVVVYISAMHCSSTAGTDGVPIYSPPDTRHMFHVPPGAAKMEYTLFPSGKAS